MSSVDVVDETFLAVPPARVAAEFADPAAWPRSGRTCGWT